MPLLLLQKNKCANFAVNLIKQFKHGNAAKKTGLYNLG